MASAVETLIRGTVEKGIGALAEFNRNRMPEPTGPHPFLTGVHTPMTEELTLTDLAVTGAIPPALDGCYLRIGPNPAAPEPAGYHWFTGDGMVHGVRLSDGRAHWYRNRWIRSQAVAKALGGEAAPGPRHGHGDTVNTNVLGIAGRTFALVEAGSYPVELSETLETLAYNPFDGSLAGSFTAHPHLDPRTGEQHAVCYEGSRPEEIRHVVLDAAGRVVREEPIAVKHGPSIHDCAITDRYVIVLDLPVTFSMKALIAGQRFPYRWNPEHQARVGLLPRNGRGNEVIWCEIDPAYVFHVANAYDAADGGVVLDVCAFDTMFAESGEGPDAPSRGLERWTIDPVARTVGMQTLDPAPQDFPRPDERYFGQLYRYAHSLALLGPEQARFEGASQLYRHDLLTGTRQTHDFGPGRMPGEFVFVPRAADAPEGDGWVMGLVIDAARERTELVILEAQDFEGPPVASIHLPHRVPPGFHGNWVPAA